MGIHGHWPVKRLRQTRGRRIGNAVAGWLVARGVVPGAVTLVTTGRRTGVERRVPVSVIRRSGNLYLVAPYGPVGWVHNVRAAGWLTLEGRAASGEFTFREVGKDEAGPVLKDYVQVATVTRPYFVAQPKDPIEAFVAEAHVHPVFALTPR